MYRRFGLSDRQIDIVGDATPKRHYYYVSPLGRRLFQFSLGPAALAFIGAGSKDDVLSARRMIARNGDSWTVEWLRQRGFEDWAEYLDKLRRATDAPDGTALSFDGMTPFHHEGIRIAEAD
jgi:type IV secretion system protein VirB4